MLLKTLSRFKSLTRSSPKPKATSDLWFYKNGELTKRTDLVLKQKESIEEFVLKKIKNYFRTMRINELNLESDLADHNLDSLDRIEILMEIEEDLGYKVATENIVSFHKPRHFVNFI